MELKFPFSQKQPGTFLKTTPEDIDVNRSLWKEVVVIMLGVIPALSAGYLISTGSFLYGVVLMTLFVIMFAVQTIFLKSIDRTLSTAFLESVGFTAPFYVVASWDYLLIAWFLMFIFLLIGFAGAHRELKGSLKIRFSTTVRAPLTYSIVGVLVVVGLVYASLFIERGVFFAKQTFAGFMASSDPVVDIFIPGFSSTQTMDQAVHTIVSSNNAVGEKILGFVGAQSPVPVDLELLSEEDKENIVDQVASEMSKSMAVAFGSTYRPEASLADNVYDRYVIPWVEGLTKQQRTYVGISAVLLLVITVRSMAFILYIPLIFIAYIIYQILLASNFAVMRLEPCSREILVLK